MSMTKRHYEAIAKVIREETDHGIAYAPPTISSEVLVERLADVFQELEMCSDCGQRDYYLNGELVCKQHDPAARLRPQPTCHRFNRQVWVEACSQVTEAV